jgi:hypothetical protein
MTGQATDSRDGEGCGGSSSHRNRISQYGGNKNEKNVFPFRALAKMGIITKVSYPRIKYRRITAEIRQAMDSRSSSSSSQIESRRRRNEIESSPRTAASGGRS